MPPSPTATTPIPGPNPFRDSTAFASTFLFILDKRKRLVKLHYNPAQTQYLNNRTRKDIILKARQMGFTTAIQAELFRLNITRTISSVTLSHEDETTQKFRRMVQRFYDHFPVPAELSPARKYNNATIATYTDFDSEALIATAGNTKTGRGGTYTHVHGSEVAFWKDAAGIMAGLMQGGNPAIVLESTANGAQGYFYETVMEALDGNTEWRLHFFPWWWDPEYRLPLVPGEEIVYSDDELDLVLAHGLTPEQIKWRRSKQRELKHLFIQEYPEDPTTCFLLSGGSYFGDLSRCYGAPLGAVYDPDHQYVAGLDFGQTEDFTVLSVFDKMAHVQVDLLRLNRLPWGEMRRQVGLKCKEWHVTLLLAEANSMGETNIEELESQFQADGLETQIVPFTTTNDSKANAASDLHEALHEGGFLLLPIQEQKNEMRAFQSRQTPTGLWQLAAANGMHDDIVMANLLANRAMKGSGIGLMRL